MGDQLDVSGGSTSVATEDLEVAAGQLGRLSGELAHLAARLARLEHPPAGGFHAEQARLEVETAARILDDLTLRAAVLRAMVDTCARGYEYQERVVESLVRSASGAAAFAGALAPGLAVSVGLAAAIAAALRGGTAEPATASGIPGAPPIVRKNNWLLTNPVLPSVVRRVTEGIGPFLLGTTGVPQVQGRHTYQAGAQGVLAAGRALGLFQETPVRLVSTIAQPVTGPPAGYAERLERVPHSDDTGGPQVVIERYSVSGEPDRFSVYVAGTATFQPTLSPEPWDTTSNVVNASGELSGSVASVHAAMDAAGIDSTNPVQLTGYSQGGGVVAVVAASGQYNLQGIVTFGGPTGEIPLPRDVPTVLVEHTDDLVPALGGDQLNTDAVLVRREVFAGETIPADYAVPAHHYEYYFETAKLMEKSGSPQLDSTMAALDGFTAGARMESSTAYRFERDG